MASGATTVKGTSITLLDSTPALLPDSAAFHGRVYKQYAEYEASSLGVGAFIKMARLPKGAVVIGGNLYCDALGASTAATIGDSDDTDRFMTTLSAVQGIGTVHGVDCGKFNAIDGIGYTYTCEKDILVCMADAAATGTIKLVIEYGLPG